MGQPALGPISCGLLCEFVGIDRPIPPSHRIAVKWCKTGPALTQEVCYGCVKNKAVAVHDGRGHAVMDGPGRGLPGQSPSVPIQLQSVGKVLSLLAGADEQNDGEELLVAFVLLLFLQHQHEVMAKTGLHHHPVDSARQELLEGRLGGMARVAPGLTLQGNRTAEATFSIARFLMLGVRAPLHVGQQLNFWRHWLHTRCPAWHCRMGGRT
ncbi:hypothetical protein MC885_005527 [Smutsia gigantea]|nr:hypothetical protein MC885_005527 [Smutsia gigantea]